MESKRCNQCLEVKPLEEFHFKDKTRGYRRDRCKLCWKIYHKAHYQANKEYYFRKKRELSKKTYTDIILPAKAVPCTDCGQSYPPYVMDFDHMRDKEFNIAVDFARFSKKKLMEEIAKCEVVCSNCHRIRTHVRREQLRV